MGGSEGNPSVVDLLVRGWSTRLRVVLVLVQRTAGRHCSLPYAHPVWPSPRTPTNAPRTVGAGWGQSQPWQPLRRAARACHPRDASTNLAISGQVVATACLLTFYRLITSTLPGTCQDSEQP